MARFTPALALIVCLASIGALRAESMTKPIGKWERKIGKNHITLLIEDNRLHISYAGEKLGTLHADYSMTCDGVIYGIVTSIECDEDVEGDVFLDAPFSFRFRIDEGALIIHGANMSHGSGSNKDDLWNGRFKAVRSPIRTAVVPTSYSAVPSYLLKPPCPIGPSFSSSKNGENNPVKSPEDIERIFNYWFRR